MIIEWGLGILIAITVAMLILRVFFSTIFKIISIIWFVMFLGTIAFGVLIYQDASDFSKGFSENENIFLLEHEGELIAGFVTKSGEEPSPAEDLDALQQSYEEDDLKAILDSGEYYKVLIFNDNCFDSVPEFDIGGINLSKESLFTIMEASDAISSYADWIIEGRGYSQNVKSQLVESLAEDGEITDDADMRSYLFRVMYTAANAKEPMLIISKYRSGDLVIYEETLVFKIIKRFPEKLIREMVGRGG